MPRLLHTYDEPAWLPSGARAEVWLASESDVPPSPVCVARLLLTDSESRILIVERADRGLDIPSRDVGSDDPVAVLQGLAQDVYGSGVEPTLLGFVRNVVTNPSADYAWPMPRAHFVVWRARAHRAPRGRWLDRRTADLELHERHWRPLLDHAPMA